MHFDFVYGISVDTREKTNRESPRINANRIFLAPSCSAPADRLRRNRTPSGKMLWEKPACGFFFLYVIFFFGAERPAVEISYFRYPD